MPTVLRFPLKRTILGYALQWPIILAAKDDIRLEPIPTSNTKHVAKSKEEEDDLNSFVATKVLGAGILAMLLAAILDLAMQEEFPFFSAHHLLEQIGKTIHVILRDGGIAAASGGAIAKILEVKNLVNFTTNIVINALTSNAYLEKLSLERIREIKEYCNHHIFKKGGNREDENIKESILKVESALSDYLFKPYYDELKIIVVCDHVKLETIPIQRSPAGNIIT